MQLPKRKPGKYAGGPSDPLLTMEKADALRARLKKLKEQRPALAADVARFAQMGDFSENAEYQHAKWQLRRVNGSIRSIENRLNHAEIIPTPTQTDVVSIGHTVSVRVNEVEVKLQILGSTETNPAKGIVSHLSPVGAALLGARIGDTRIVQAGDKQVVYTILSIS